LETRDDQVLKEWMPSLRSVFDVTPFLSVLTASRNLWNLCEDTIANLAQRLTHLISAAFVFQGKLVHTSMDPKDVFALFTVYQVRISDIITHWPGNPNDEGKLIWVAALNHAKIVNLTSGPASVGILHHNSLLIFLAFGKSKEIVDEMSVSESIVRGMMHKLVDECSKIPRSETKGAQYEFWRDGLCSVRKQVRGMPREGGKNAKESKKRPIEKPIDGLIDLLSGSTGESVRFAGETVRQMWLFGEKDDDCVTLLEAKADSISDIVNSGIRVLKGGAIG
jgi:hypothetical protein